MTVDEACKAIFLALSKFHTHTHTHTHTQARAQGTFGSSGLLAEGALKVTPPSQAKKYHGPYRMTDPTDGNLLIRVLHFTSRTARLSAQ